MDFESKPKLNRILALLSQKVLEKVIKEIEVQICYISEWVYYDNGETNNIPT